MSCACLYAWVIMRDHRGDPSAGGSIAASKPNLVQQCRRLPPARQTVFVQVPNPESSRGAAGDLVRPYTRTGSAGTRAPKPLTARLDCDETKSSFGTITG